MTSTEIKTEHIGQIEHLLNQVKKHVIDNPQDLEVVMTELHAIINKCDPEIKQGASVPYSLVNNEFKPQVKMIKEKIFNVIGRQMKIPDLRFEADHLSHELQIPLPNSTRKNNEALMQWFDTYWGRLEPRLKELRGKETKRG